MQFNGHDIKAIIFDLDGTLLDTSKGITNAVIYTINQLGLPMVEESVLRKFVGPPIQESLINYCGLDAQQAQQAANMFRNYYMSTTLYEAQPYDQIISTIKELRNNGAKIAVATYKRKDYAIDLLQHFNIAQLCDVIHGADNENKLTKADIINLCCQELGIEKNHILMVGDTEYDARGAYNAGLPFVAVTWGFGYQQNNFASQYPNIGIANKTTDLLR